MRTFLVISEIVDMYVISTVAIRFDQIIIYSILSFTATCFTTRTFRLVNMYVIHDIMLTD